MPSANRGSPIHAAFTPNPPGGGSVGVSRAAFSGGNRFVGSTLVTVVATPANGWSFLGWLGDASGTNSKVVLPMRRDMAVEALFGTRLGSNVLGPGRIQFSPQVPVYPFGAPVGVTAIPQPGSYLMNWAGALSGSNNPNSLVVTSSPPIVTALFRLLAANQYALSVVPRGGGSVTISPHTNRYASGTPVTLTAIAGPGDSFLGWGGDASGWQNPLTVTMNQSKVITANFTRRPLLSTAPPLNRMDEQGFRFSIIGELGAAMRVDSSTNLVNWSVLGWLTNDFGTSQVLDTAASTNVLQFYRALTP